MISPEVSDRVATVILGATRARGFALVLFYDDDGMSEITNLRDAVVSNADPQSAADMLIEIAPEFYRALATDSIPRAG